MRKCGLLGKNIKYSLSPTIHNDFYKEKQIHMHYELFDIEENELPLFIKKVKNDSIIGFNVTIPYKEKIVELLDGLEYPANILKSVNTVLVKEDTLIGFNTDYYGFIASLNENHIEINDARALVIGLGGVALSVILALQDLNIKEIDIAVRDIEKAREKLKKSYAFNKIKHIKDLNGTIEIKEYNIIINCTPIGGANHEGESPISINSINKEAVVYDLNYNPEKSKLLIESEKMGAKIINGRQMLLLQAMKAIHIWENYMEGRK